MEVVRFKRDRAHDEESNHPAWMGSLEDGVDEDLDGRMRSIRKNRTRELGII